MKRRWGVMTFAERHDALSALSFFPWLPVNYAWSTTWNDHGSLMWIPTILLSSAFCAGFTWFVAAVVMSVPAMVLDWWRSLDERIPTKRQELETRIAELERELGMR